MNKTIVTVVGILSFSALVGFYIWLSNNRFYVSSSEKGMCYEVDRRTGDSWFLVGETKTYQKDPFKEASISKALEEIMPKEELAKVTGNAGFNHGMLDGRIYNGSNWKITRLILTVAAKYPKSGMASLFSKDWKRDISTNVSIDPLKTSSFSEVITSDDDAICEWFVKEAYGIKNP